MAGGHLDGDRLYERYEEYQTEQELQKMYENIVINTDNLIACNDCTPDPGVIGDETIFDYIPNPKSLWKFLRKGIIKRFGKRGLQKFGSNKKFNKQVHDVANKLKLNAHQVKKFKKEIHRLKRGKRGDDNFSWDELIEIGRDSLK